MSCYQPYFGGRPYFAVLSKCGFDETRCGYDEQGGTVDCIKTINNASGINDLLVRQDGDQTMTHSEGFQELEELLEFPSHFSTSDLDSRFRDLCDVLQKAKDKLSWRIEEDHENPFQELRLQLQKAKDRFHARIAAVERNSRQRTAHHSGPISAPFQELRDAFRNARKHFIPLIDQYVNRNDSYSHKDDHFYRKSHFQPLSIAISTTNALDSTILRANELNDDSHTRPPQLSPRFKTTHNASIGSTTQGRLVNRTVGSTGPIADPPRAGRLESLITEELQRRCERHVIHRARSTAFSHSAGFRAPESNTLCHQSVDHGKPNAHGELDPKTDVSALNSQGANVFGDPALPMAEASVIDSVCPAVENEKTFGNCSPGVERNRQPPKIGSLPNYCFEPVFRGRVLS